MAARQLHLLRCNLPDNQRRKKGTIFCRQLDPSESYTDSELRSRYRFGREAIQYIVNLVADEIKPLNIERSLTVLSSVIKHVAGG